MTSYQRFQMEKYGNVLMDGKHIVLQEDDELENGFEESEASERQADQRAELELLND